MPEANWACPICQAAHLDPLSIPRDIVETHDREHRGGEHGSTAWYDWTSGRVVRDGNGNRWANREPFNPQPKLDDFAQALDPDDGCSCVEDYLAEEAGQRALFGEPEPERITDEAWRLVMGDRVIII